MNKYQNYQPNSAQDLLLAEDQTFWAIVDSISDFALASPMSVWTASYLLAGTAPDEDTRPHCDESRIQIVRIELLFYDKEKTLSRV